MAYIQVEASVRTHRKFLKAGPAASWLWLCGVGYCQDGLTDGFIPFEAIDFLGIKGTTARKLKVTLVAVGLWDEVAGGWQVHDYLKHNKSAAAVADVKARRGSGGKDGGRPKKPSSETLEVTPTETLPETFPEMSRDVAVDGDVVLKERGSGKTAALFQADVALKRLQAAYPPHRVTSGYKTEVAFIQELNSGESASATYAAMCANLENHVKSHEWRVKGMAPALEKWLREGLWKRQMDEAAPVAEQLTAKTNRTLSAAAGILREGA